MAGIYIHIPFCRQKCHYCNFFSIASTKDKAAFLDALKIEIESRKGYLNNETVQTVYIGGGTPSLLTRNELTDIFNWLSAHFEFDPNAEITLEANPDDINPTFVDLLLDSPVNRLSMGVQSFFDDDLVYLHRVHQADHARKAIELCLSAGIDKLTIDLIYGIPTLTDEKWHANINTFLDYGLNHLSAYALTVEPKTALHQLIRKGKWKNTDEYQAAAHFELLMEILDKEKFIHYEISNFARPGHYSRHNSLYWLGGNYLGLGPSAHSFNGFSRQWNTSSVDKYIKLSASPEELAEKEILSHNQRYNEYVMTSLRTSWGCDLEHIRNVFGEQFADYCFGNAQSFINEGKIMFDGQRFFLTASGKLFADGIAASLFADSD
jgi:oxygen-independent coproporphyrinogen III oxidase